MIGADAGARAADARPAAAFRALHHGSALLVVPNVWDVTSARLAEHAGFTCLGTTSAGIAWSLGYPDGQRVPRDEMLRVVERIARHTSLPVTADIEAGYGSSPATVAETVRLAIGAGAVGINLEDATGDPAHPLYDLPAQAERVAAARRGADEGGIHAVVNARTDVYWLRIGADVDRLQHAIERLRAYHRAGADVVFAPGVADAAAMQLLAAKVDAPLNVLAGPGTPAPDTLVRLGVARLSIGSALCRVAATAVRGALRSLSLGNSDALVGALPYVELDALHSAR